jgi:DNA-binding beta-propeller fold protein YncE
VTTARAPAIATAALIAATGSLAIAAAGGGAPPTAIAVPDGARGIGYDDIQYAPGLKRILVPAGRTGRLVLIDPATKTTSSITGFSSTASFKGGHGEGTTSAAELDGRAGTVVATDRGSRTLKIADARSNAIIGSVKLAAAPDYVRVVPAAREIWVTEPGRKQLEVFRAGDGGGAALSHVVTIAVPDGPESLVIDAVRHRAYSHTWTDQSFAIDLDAHKLVSTWRNGCRQSRGIALDEKRGLLFSGCAEGKATVVDLRTSKVVDAADAGADVDSIGFAAALGHLYVPGGGSADLAIFAVSAAGKLARLGKVATAADAHTVAFDPATRALFVGAPAHGTVLVIPDPFPPSPE